MQIHIYTFNVAFRLIVFKKFQAQPIKEHEKQSDRWQQRYQVAIIMIIFNHIQKLNSIFANDLKLHISPILFYYPNTSIWKQFTNHNRIH